MVPLEDFEEVYWVIRSNCFSSLLCFARNINCRDGSCERMHLAGVMLVSSQATINSSSRYAALFANPIFLNNLEERYLPPMVWQGAKTRNAYVCIVYFIEVN